MVHFTEINQTPPPYSILQDVGREATPKLATTNCPKYLQTTLIMGWGGLVSEFMWGIVGPVYLTIIYLADAVSKRYKNYLIIFSINCSCCCVCSLSSNCYSFFQKYAWVTLVIETWCCSLVVLNLTFCVLYIQCNWSFILTKFFVLNLDGGVVVCLTELLFFDVPFIYMLY